MNNGQPAAGFLPTRFQGVKFRGSGDPVLYLSNPEGMSRQVRRDLLDDLARMNQITLREFGDPEIATRIAQYEMAYRLQTSAPELMDLKSEGKATLDLYGIDDPVTRDYGSRCLIARRLVERGVRFVQIFTGNQTWDHHGDIVNALPAVCKRTDKPAAR